MSDTGYVMHPGSCVVCSRYEWRSEGGLSYRKCSLIDEPRKFPGKRCDNFEAKEGIDMRVVSYAHLEAYK